MNFSNQDSISDIINMQNNGDVTTGTFFSDYNDLIEEISPNNSDNYNEANQPFDIEHICGKSLNLDLRLQKANQVIKKLQQRCTEKSKEIFRLRAALKRSEVNRSNLKELLKSMKDNKIISDECHRIMEVS